MALFSQLSRDVKKTKKALIQARNRANELTARDVIKAAQYYSSGKVSTSALAKPPYSHPYRISGGGKVPYGDLAIINRQTGVFWKSWRIITTLTMPDGVKIPVVANIASYATFLEHGTSRMKARPIDKVLADYARDRAWFYAQQEMAKAFENSFLNGK